MSARLNCFTALFAFGVALPAWASDLVIYDDALENNFLDYSYNPGTSDFSNAAPVHGGAKSIAFTPGGYDAVKVANNTTLFDTANYSRLHLWFHGTATQCQDLSVILERDNGGSDVQVASAALGAYANCAGIVAGQWLEVTVDFGAAPMSYAGTYGRISLFDEIGAAFGTVYFDDLSLQAPVNDEIFKGDFETGGVPPPVCGMTDKHDQPVTPAPGDTMTSDVLDWCDSAGKPREAVLAHNDQTGKQAVGGYPNHGGSLQQFSYQMPDNSTRTATITDYGNGGYGGFGYVVSHSQWLSDGFCSGDDSPLGYAFTGTWTRVFEGRHHAIFRFQQNYQRHCGPSNPAPTTLVPVTIDWIFSTGRDHPLWAITYDLIDATADGNPIAQNFLYDDSRAPYGELNIDGEGSIDIDGVAWGDKYKFTTTTTPAKLNSSWDWSAHNTIPYVKEWIVSSDATMGLVQTQTIDQQDAGGGRNPFYHDLTAYWGTTSASGNACPSGPYSMPCQDGWPYQANNDSINVGAPSNNARLTWGTQYGFLGQSTYAANTTIAPDPDDGPYPPGWPKKSYSVYIVLGPHSTSPVEAQVTQVETAQTLTLSAATGSVITDGPAGVNRGDTITYAPAGYDPVYGALAFNASANALDANVAVGSGTLKKPLIIVHNYTSAAFPAAVKLGGTTLAMDVDYFPSLRTTASELWITLNRDLTGPTNHLQVTP